MTCVLFCNAFVFAMCVYLMKFVNNFKADFDAPPTKKTRFLTDVEKSNDVSITGLPAAKHGDQPDSDAIKMFIGQIPKTWSEVEVRNLLEKYGPIYQLNILREKGSVLSKGMVLGRLFSVENGLLNAICQLAMWKKLSLTLLFSLTLF